MRISDWSSACALPISLARPARVALDGAGGCAGARAGRRSCGQGGAKRRDQGGLHYAGSRRRLMQDSMLLPAMPDPVMATQGVFRLALSAMSEPGTLQQVDHAVVLDRLAPATYALCLTLFDADTPVWLAPSDRKSTRLNSSH